MQSSQGPSDETDAAAIVFFDGVCGLCNRTVDALLALDRQGVLKFAPLQGKTAQKLLDESDRNLSSIVFFDRGRVWKRSAAIVRILWRLNGIWSMAGTCLWLIPAPLRDMGYGGVARLRYRLFGRRETCRLPKAGERDRFLP